MNHLNRIFHGKNNKFLYFLHGAGEYLMPKAFFRLRLAGVLARARKRPDWEYICNRADYYNKMQFVENLSEELLPIKEHKYGRGVKSAYFFDSYKYTRWFAGHLRWKLIPGDVITVPEHPAVVKSRPIAGDNYNSVLLNLDKARHFVFLRDDIPLRDKQNRSIFRLAIDGRPHREKFVRMYFDSPCCDVGVVPWRKEFPAEWAVPKISLYDHLAYKFILAIEGNDVATNLKWVMSSNSLAVMPRPTYETWFMEGKLIPNYHYVEIKSDYSDLEERMQYYIEHPDEAERIVANAHAYIDQFRDRKREKLISLLVLQRYFERTGQIG